jgi:hypothetical protein
MHAMTQGMEPPVDEVRERQEQAVTPGLPTVIWVHDGPVCVDVLDVTPAPPPGLHCTCAACAATRHADWANRFLK